MGIRFCETGAPILAPFRPEPYPGLATRRMNLGQHDAANKGRAAWDAQMVSGLDGPADRGNASLFRHVPTLGSVIVAAGGGTIVARAGRTPNQKVGY